MKTLRTLSIVRCILPTLALLLCLSAPQEIQATDSPPFSVTFAEVEKSVPSLLIDFGQLVQGEDLSIELSIKNLGDQPLALSAVSEGPAVDVTWPDDQPAARLEAGESQQLTVNFEALPPTQAQLQGVLLWSQEQHTAFITLSYLAFEQAGYNFPISSGKMTSPAGKGYSDWFRICSGPPAPGYVPTSCYLSLSGSKRKECGKWTKCRQSSYSSNNLCMEFKIQGHEERNLGLKYKETRSSTGNLDIRYDLIRSAPRILEIGEEPTLQPLQASSNLRCTTD